jgi:hypothetical protein
VIGGRWNCCSRNLPNGGNCSIGWITHHSQLSISRHRVAHITCITVNVLECNSRIGGVACVALASEVIHGRPNRSIERRTKYRRIQSCTIRYVDGKESVDQSNGTGCQRRRESSLGLEKQDIMLWFKKEDSVHLNCPQHAELEPACCSCSCE